MSTDVALWMVAAFAVVIVAVIIVIIRELRDDDDPPIAISRTGHPQHTPRRPVEAADIWSAYTDPCAAPRHPLLAHEAHRVMRDHREHSIDDCPHKRAAYMALVAAGAIVPPGEAVRRRAHVR